MKYLCIQGYEYDKGNPVISYNECGVEHGFFKKLHTAFTRSQISFS